jgi:hypothetical protein
VEGALPAPDACHCRQCRKQSGHFFVSTDVPRSALTVHGSELVGWFRSSPKVRRGFCSKCGSPLFWDPPPERAFIGVAMGAFDGPTETTIRIHVHVDEKGDYYELDDDVPKHET